MAGSTVQLHATPNFTVAAFATGTQGENNSQDGSYGQYAGDNLSVPYGVGTIAWDGITYDAADGSTGSALITANFESANNTELLVSMAPGYNNWYYEGGSASCPTGTVDFTQYHAVQFDILWNTNSQLTIDQFNTGNNWPSNLLIPGVGSNYMATNSYYTAGVNVEMFTGSGGNTVYLGTFQVPEAAATGWQTVIMPYSDTLANLGPGAGLWFQGSFGGGAGLNGGGPVSASFWIDNVTLVGNVTISGPPTVSPPVAATAGLNIFNAAEGTGSFPFSDRNEVLAKTTTGLSWVSNTPTSYSVDLTGFPAGLAYSGEAYMFLVPNSSAEDVAADYNEAACMVLEVQTTPTGGQASLSYKVNEPQGETYTTVSFGSYTGASAPTNATNYVPTSQILGNYTLTFTGNDAGTVTTPDGTTGAFTLPAGTGTTYFAEGIAEPVPTNASPQADNYNFLIYIGGQANDISFLNKPTVYGSVTVTGPPNGSQASENFISDANSSLPLQNWGASWTGNATTTPSAVVLVPTNAPYWVDWTTPASGYVLAEAPTLANADWLNVSTFSPIFLTGEEAQLVSQNDLPSTKSEFFAMVHRSFSQLLILLPGQTNTPGVAPGYAGTPTPVGTGGTYGEENVTVLAVDSEWNPVGGINDVIAITSSDGSAIKPTPQAMANGSVTFGPSNPFFFATAGSQTVMATDTTTTNIPVATSAAVTVTNP